MSTPGSSSPDHDGDESSKTEKSQPNIQDELQVFREQWQKELKSPVNNDKSKDSTSSSAAVKQDVKSDEDKAKILFRNGIEYEQKGKVYEAMQYYRKAIQIDPDVEFKMYEHDFLKTKPSSETDVQKKAGNKKSDTANDTVNDNLLSHLQKVVSESTSFCKPMKETTETHFSMLPPEIILYILQWVVSNDLDLRSLEQCSAVCRGLFLLSRDTEIWRLACIRVWGLNGLSLKDNVYSSYRQMYIERSRVKFNGCYISKTTYLRYGENSFQDQFYRPWHLIEYYRYIRFFPEGRVLMLTSSEEPASMVSHLKHRFSRHESIMTGHYRLQDDIVVLVVKRSNYTLLTSRQKKRREGGIDTGEQTFQLELKITSPPRRRFAQLIWNGYKVFTSYKNGNQNQNDFDLIGSRYPPFWFSRVKSYHAESETPLKLTDEI